MLAVRARVRAHQAAHAVAVEIDIANVNLGEIRHRVNDRIKIQHLLVDEVAQILGI